MQKHFHEVAQQYVSHWVEAKIFAHPPILKQYQETFEVDSSKHIFHDDEDSECANSTFCTNVDLLSARSRNVLNCSFVWMDENILFDDCFGHPEPNICFEC